MKLSMIVAMARNRVIGRDKELVWHYPEDFKYFKEKTTGHPIVMGQNTYESIGRPLPNRRNIVLTKEDEIQGVECFHNIPDLMDNLEKTTPEDEKVFIIGGAYVYKQFLPLVETLYLTDVKKEYEGNIFFPEFEDMFEEVSRNDRGEIDFVVYKRK
ncbi:dihydrofolate reductase [Candidatus Gracilibacteria bacterium]|nr:dihydrofolate reductase [Candidatus Gracilibacteria bacterium]